MNDPKIQLGAWEIIKFWIVLIGIVSFPFFIGTFSKIPEHQSWFETHIAIPGPMIGPNARETIVIDKPKPQQP